MVELVSVGDQWGTPTDLALCTYTFLFTRDSNLETKLQLKLLIDVRYEQLMLFILFVVHLNNHCAPLYPLRN